MRHASMRSPWHLWILVAAFSMTVLVYWTGLRGGFLFDDYPNIVDNKGVQPPNASLSSMMSAALSSPSSEFKRPLASLSFAANYLVTGIDPYWMKLTNLVIHLLNGWLVFLLAKGLIRSVAAKAIATENGHSSEWDFSSAPERSAIVAALIAACWMLLPINLSAVLYVVQRMESMANVFVLLGLIGYVTGRQRMLAARDTTSFPGGNHQRQWFCLCAASITIPTAIGLLAKETAVMLPLYAISAEGILFSFSRRAKIEANRGERIPAIIRHRRDWRLIGLFFLVLAIPLVLGLLWQLPSLLQPERWSTRDFSLHTRLLSEARIIVDYIVWTLLPAPHALSFYHDDFQISTGLLAPWTTLASIVTLVALITLMLSLRTYRPLAALGIALFLGCQLLTGTVLPLELIYEHRNYFASFGLMLLIVPLLAVPRTAPLAMPRYLMLAGLMVSWATLTALTAYEWSNPLRLAKDLAMRDPRSPRAQYELGRTYIIYSQYQPTSPFARLAYPPLEKSAALPNSSILPEQALIFMNARMHLPIKAAWWDSLTSKLKARKPGVQDESSLAALTQCVRDHHCDLPADRMMNAYGAALSHPNPSAGLLASYGDYAWNVLNDHTLGERVTVEAVKTSPDEPAYRITLIRMLAAQGRNSEASQELRKYEHMNIGGRLDSDVAKLKLLVGQH
jgi:hypothetical protein